MKRKQKLLSVSFASLFTIIAQAEETIGVSVDLQTPVASTPVEAVSQTVDSVIKAIEEDTRELTPAQQQARTELYDTLTIITTASAEEKELALKSISPKANTANATVTRRNPVGFNMQAASSRFALLRQSAKTSLYSPRSRSRKSSRSVFSPYVLRASDPNEAGGLFDNRLSTFFTFDYANSEQTETAVQTGFDGGVTAFSGGLDYRLNPQSFAGVAFNYANAEVDLSAGGGLDSRSYSLNTYGAYYLDENISFQASVSLGSMNYDMARNVIFTVGGTTTSKVANSNPEGGHFGLSLGAAFDKSFQEFSGGLFTQLNFSRASIDGFSETGAGGLNLAVDEQTVNSLSLNFGGQLSIVISTRWGIVTPYLKAMYAHEFNKEDEEVRAYFVNDPSRTYMAFEAKTQDANFLKSTLGSSFVLPQGVMAFAQIDFTHLIQHYSQTNYTLGVRKEL